MVTCVFQTINECGSEWSPVCFRASVHVVQNGHLCVLEHQCMWFRTVTCVFQSISACGSEQSPMCFRPSMHVVQNSHLCVSDHQCMWFRTVTCVFQNVNVRDGELPEDAVQIQPQSVRITIRPSKLPPTVHQPCWFPCHHDGAVSVTVPDGIIHLSCGGSKMIFHAITWNCLTWAS